MAIIAASIYGASDEYHQYFVPGRVCDWVDWVADTLGATLAAWLYAIWTPYRKFLEFPLFPKGEKMSRINKMSDEQAEQEIEELRQEIARHDELYYRQAGARYFRPGI